MMRRLSSLAALALLTSSPALAQSVRDPNFVIDRIYGGNGMVALDFGPQNRLYVGEKRGRVLVMTRNASGGYNAPTVFADLTGQVNPTQESGLLGLVLDPDFANNRYLYLFYTTTTDQRLTRVTASADFSQMVAGSETPLLTGLPRAVTFHKAGDIHFAPNDPNNIYITQGDDGRPAEAQDLASYRGKLLRVNKANGQGLASNPYQDGNLNSARSRFWAIGFRNPFRFTFHPNMPSPDVLYVSENGNSTDRVSRVRIGSNGAWSAAGDNGGFTSPPDVNHRVMTTFTAPTSALGIAIARGGPFSDQANPGSDVIYVANWLRPQGGGIFRWRLTGANLDTVTPIAADQGQPFATNINAMTLRFGPDGALYTTHSGNDASTGTFYTIRRIRFAGGVPPAASFNTNPANPRGAVPFTVSFTDTSNDPDGTIGSWAWSFGDGATSNQRNPSHTYNNPGTYQATLTVTDDDGQQNTASRTVTAIRALNLTLRGRIDDARGASPVPLAAAAVIRIFGPDGTTPIAFAGGTGAENNGLDVPAGGTFDRTIQLEVTTPSLVITAGSGNTFEPITRGFLIPAGATAHTEQLQLYLSDTVIRGRVRDTRGAAAAVDLGIARNGEGTPYAIAGGRDYLPASGIPASQVAHRITSDALGYYYFPIRSGDGNARFYVDAVADTGRDTYLPAVFDEQVAAGGRIVHDLTLGLKQGGAGCTDIAGMPDVPAVDYATQIQPIWDGACTGCHNAGSGNSGGLDLERDSYAHLVGVDSLEVMGRKLVQPGAPDQSFLFEKINCDNPQVGTRMRPADPMPEQEQILIRSWIAQGARLTPVMPGDDAGISADAAPGDGAPRPDAAPDAAIAADGATADAQVEDAGTSTRTDGGRAVSPGRRNTTGGCGCSTSGSERSSTWGAVLALLLAALAGFRRSPKAEAADPPK